MVSTSAYQRQMSGLLSTTLPYAILFTAPICETTHFTAQTASIPFRLGSVADVSAMHDTNGHMHRVTLTTGNNLPLPLLTLTPLMTTYACINLHPESYTSNLCIYPVERLLSSLPTIHHF